MFPTPNFQFLHIFIREMSKVKNDPGFERCLQTSLEPSHKSNPPLPVISARKTEVEPSPNPVLRPDKMCRIHRTKRTLNACRAFKAKYIEERRKLLRQKNACFKCCESDNHAKNACVQDVKCIYCSSSSHLTTLHIVKNESVQASDSSRAYGGEYSRRQDIAPLYRVCRHYCKMVTY